MLSVLDNELLTRTGAGTPMGRLMRRYWLPVMLSSELPAPDAPPRRVRVMGEDLVGFRDTNGRLGLLAEHCSHRGTSLFYGRNEECGLRCIYHGWKYDVDGNVVDTPAEPGGSKLGPKVKHTAYPCHEVAGLIWAYMGPKEHQPLFPNYLFAEAPPENVWVTKCILECNYLQGLEGEVDSAHLSFLHKEWGPDSADDRQGLFQQDTVPSYEIEETDFGLRLVALRAAGPGEQYVRVTSFVMPVTCWINGRGTKAAHIYVPIDDTHTWRIDMGVLDRPATAADASRAEEIGPDFRKVRNIGNDYLQDRERQRESDFTGISVFLNEDAAATESMGPLFDRSGEHLGVSDRGVIALRRYLLSAVRSLADGGEPPHQVTDPRRNDMRHIDTIAEVIPAAEHWREHFPHLTRATPLIHKG